MFKTLAEFSVARWPLARILVLLLAGGFLGLMIDIRVEHVEAVRERAVAWVPILYAGVMAIACILEFLIWNTAARIVTSALFLIAFAIGGIGFYFHYHGKIKPVLVASINAWTDPAMNHSDGPPQVAPLAFGGLGAIGILASLKRFG